MNEEQREQIAMVVVANLRDEKIKVEDRVTVKRKVVHLMAEQDGKKLTRVITRAVAKEFEKGFEYYPEKLYERFVVWHNGNRHEFRLTNKEGIFDYEAFQERHSWNADQQYLSQIEFYLANIPLIENFLISIVRYREAVEAFKVVKNSYRELTPMLPKEFKDIQQFI